MKHRVYIGIDVGKDGGIVALNENQNIILKSIIPKISNKVDYKSLFEVLLSFKKKDVIVAIEEVHSIFGMSAKSNFSFGRIKGVKIGMVEALAVLYGYRYIMVQPKDWQKRIWNIQDMVYKPKKEESENNYKPVNTKATSLLASRRLFPNEDFRKTERCKNPHDGMVDASLIAMYLCLEYK